MSETFHVEVCDDLERDQIKNLMRSLNCRIWLHTLYDAGKGPNRRKKTGPPVEP